LIYADDAFKNALPAQMERKMEPTNKDELIRLIDKSEMIRADVADYLGIKPRTLYTWLNGEVRVPKMALIALKVLVKEV
jgi:DNA-binding transcriptional regulator YiaG